MSIIHTQVCKEVKCKKPFRARVDHRYCRKCHRVNLGTARPIASRELSKNKFRRTRKRRKSNSAVIKVAAARGKKK